jgi:hypothetical protein
VHSHRLEKCVVRVPQGEPVVVRVGREMPAKALTDKLAREAIVQFNQLGSGSKFGSSSLAVTYTRTHEN